MTCPKVPDKTVNTLTNWRACVEKLGPEWVAKGKWGGVTGKLTCTRKQCLGDAEDCCTKGSDGSRGCLAEYTGLTSHCNVHMLKFCTRDRLFGDPRCIQWSKKNAAVADVHAGNICNSPTASGLTADGRVSAPCVKWCVTHPGRCDATMRVHCAAGAGPECACINNTIRKSLPLYTPECYDRVCKTGGYMTGAMKTVAGAGMCPSVMRCSAGVNIAPGALANVLSNVTVDQSCLSDPDGGVVESTLRANTQSDGRTSPVSTSTTAQPKPKTDPQNGPAKPATAHAAEDGPMPAAVWIFIVLVVLAFLMAVAGFAFYGGAVTPRTPPAPGQEPVQQAQNK